MLKFSLHPMFFSKIPDSQFFLNLNLVEMAESLIYIS